MNGKTIFNWTGKSRGNETSEQTRERETDNLADAIANAVPNLFQRDDRIVQLDKNGGFNVVSFAVFRVMVDTNICGERVVPNGAGWKHEYHTYAFNPQPRPDFKHGGRRPPPNQTEPDADILDKIYRDELAWRLPRVVE
jgi:hypothetical protein